MRYRVGSRASSSSIGPASSGHPTAAAGRGEGPGRLLVRPPPAVAHPGPAGDVRGHAVKTVLVRGLEVYCTEEPRCNGWAGGGVSRRGARYLRVTDTDGRVCRLIEDPDSGLDYDGPVLNDEPPPHIIEVLHEASGLAFASGEDDWE